MKRTIPVELSKIVSAYNNLVAGETVAAEAILAGIIHDHEADPEYVALSYSRSYMVDNFDYPPDIPDDVVAEAVEMLCNDSYINSEAYAALDELLDSVMGEREES